MPAHEDADKQFRNAFAGLYTLSTNDKAKSPEAVLFYFTITGRESRPDDESTNAEKDRCFQMVKRADSPRMKHKI